jgi:hypothetical protein
MRFYRPGSTIFLTVLSLEESLRYYKVYFVEKPTVCMKISGKMAIFKKHTMIYSRVGKDQKGETLISGSAMLFEQ